MVEYIIISIIIVIYAVEKVLHVNEIKNRDAREEKLLDRLLGRTETDESPPEASRVKSDDKPRKRTHPFEELKKNS